MNRIIHCLNPCVWTMMVILCSYMLSSKVYKQRVINFSDTYSWNNIVLRPGLLWKTWGQKAYVAIKQAPDAESITWPNLQPTVLRLPTDKFSQTWWTSVEEEVINLCCLNVNQLVLMFITIKKQKCLNNRTYADDNSDRIHSFFLKHKWTN